ncbi:hypothetical protein CS542_00895 [Pedobacter sp. IW39]|nr:hypothetical protein CS542_00895 [Pedobacter sp. IW39]
MADRFLNLRMKFDRRKTPVLKNDEFNLLVFKEKLERLYLQSMNKTSLSDLYQRENEHIPFIKISCSRLQEILFPMQ